MTVPSKPVSRGAMRRSGRAGFTLVEVLVVLVIVVILAGVTVPAIVGMGRGSALQGAISNVRSTISLARQWAITNRKHTYVVFPDVTLIARTSGEVYAYRAYAVYEYDPITQVGQYVSDWKFLPKGMVFDDDAGRGQNVYGTDRKSVAYPENGSANEFLNVIGFKPTGSAMVPTGYEVYLREGYSEVDGVLNYDIVHEDETDYGIQVSGLTGGARVINYHGEP